MRQATVILKSYFDDLCRDPRYSLTALGASMPGLFVSQEIANNQFKISGGKPGAKVSWEISAVRNDAYVQRKGIVDVIDKGSKRGKYIQPALYGKGVDKANFSRPTAGVESALTAGRPPKR